MRRNGPVLRVSALLVAVSLSLFLHVGCGDDDGGTGPAKDTTPPTIASIAPDNGSTGISLNAVVEISFSEDVEPTSCTPQSIHLDHGVTGTVSVSGRVATFTPSAMLAPSTQYQVTVTTAVCDKADNPLAQAFTSTFTTSGLPVADPGDDFFVSRGGTVSIDASHSSGPMGGALTYAWTQIAGPQVPALAGATPTFSAPAEVSTLVFSLVVSEGGIVSPPAQLRVMVLEDRAHAFFVHPSGSDQASGTVDAPFATIARAIAAAHDENAGGDVYVAAGDYDGPVDLVTEVSIYGGYDPATWRRDASQYVSWIGGSIPAVRGNHAHDLSLDGLSIESDDAVDFGASSVALVLDACVGVEVSRSTIRSGRGMHGLPGGDGEDGLVGLPGGNGSARTGGAAGAGPGCKGGAGGTGGFDWESGGVGHAGDPVGEGGGAAGSAGGYNGRGGNGGSGEDAPLMAPDGAGGAVFGAWIAGAYVTARGEAGVQIHGCGGGGGGGGGAEGVYNGGGGGGGGAGGEGGHGGIGGDGGGASIAMVLAGGSQVAITACTLATRAGGNGGWGGEGGEGAAGGNGGGSGAPQGDGFWLEGEEGGLGGTGGHGAKGGYGGGGGGGPVIGILAVQSQCARTNLVFQLGDPGDGGSRPDGLGQTGSTGEAAEYKSMN